MEWKKNQLPGAFDRSMRLLFNFHSKHDEFKNQEKKNQLSRKAGRSSRRPSAVALWIKLARKKSFWSPNTKPWRQMVTTSGILMRNKIEKGKRINKGVHISRMQCNGEELFAKNINWLNFHRIWHCHHVCVFSGWYPFVEFCVNVGNYGGKLVIINWLNFCRIWHCNQICVFQSDTLLLSFTLMLANMVGNRLNCTIWYKKF